MAAPDALVCLNQPSVIVEITALRRVQAAATRFPARSRGSGVNAVVSVQAERLQEVAARMPDSAARRRPAVTYAANGTVSHARPSVVHVKENAPVQNAQENSTCLQTHPLIALSARY